MLKQQKKDVIGKEIRVITDRLEHEENEVLLVTSKMIRTVYVEAKSNVPFSMHRNFVVMQNLNGVNVGYHHYDKNGAIRMIDSMSRYMHEILVNHLVKSASPFSIILDTSSDIEGRHYMVTYLQAIEDNTPIVYFYKLIEMTQDVTAQGHYNVLMNAINEEKQDMSQYFKRYMVGFASDGASVMTRKYNGLVTKVRAHVDNPIYAVHCMAHRLQLAIGNAFATDPFFEELDNTVNFAYAFYNRGEKREAHLRATAITMNVNYYRLTYIYDVRWVSSQVSAMTSIHLMWSVIITDLNAIKNDNSFSETTKQKARKLLRTLTGREFMVIFHFVLDVLQEFKTWSKRMQTRGSLLADYTEFYTDIEETFNELKKKNGVYLIKYLVDVDCNNIFEYYTKQTISYNYVELHRDPKINDRVPIPKLHEIRDTFLTKVIEEIENYFPEGNLQNFKIFQPKNLPRTIGQTSTYGLKEVLWICDYFKWDKCMNLVDEWKHVLMNIIDSDSVCALRQRHTQTAKFWSEALNMPDIGWKESVEKLVKTMLVLTTGSSEAERGFSIMNHIKYDRRSRLSPDNLESLMRIRINGPDNMDQFIAIKYARKWIKENHYRTDDPRAKSEMGSDLTLENENTAGFSARSNLF